MSLAYAFVLFAATAEVHEIRGRVGSVQKNEPLEGALVILQCTCIEGSRETITDANGRYRFVGLRAGTYVVSVLRGNADVSRVVRVGLAK